MYYAVAPLVRNMEGGKSYTINYTLQGVECYIRSFLASLINNTVELNLSLGTLYNISSIVLEKSNGINFRPIQQIGNNNSLTVIFRDSNLTTGLNTYRIRINLAGAKVIYTLPETIYYFTENNFLIYPNPAAQHNEINVVVKNIDISIMEVYNALGIKVFEKTLAERVNRIPAGIPSKGIYYIKISNNGIKEAILKLVIY